MDEQNTAHNIGLVYLAESLETNRLARAFKDSYELTGRKIATAESCTGGLISAAITEVSGSSLWFDRGFVTYSNEAKMELLGVKEQTLQAFGAVSLETAREMAAGALAHSNADVAVSVTGIAGPTGGTEQKPVGTVCIGLKRRDQEQAVACEFHFAGDRYFVRYQTVMKALESLLTFSAAGEIEGFV